VAASYRLRLVSATRQLFDGQVTYAHVAGIDGEMGILAHHLPLVTALEIAPVEIETAEGERLAFAVHGGFVEVGVDGVTILAEVAEARDDIRVERARAALERAQARLAGGSHEGEVDRVRAEAARRRALTRLRVAGALDGAEAARGR
jgi:F-type H+-transporting ATPase subunit epsilon